MTIIYQKNKKFLAFGTTIHGQKKEKGKRRKYIKKQQIRNQNLKTVPISMENKKKRTTHPEIWILENRNRGFASTYRNMHFFLFSSSFFSLLLLLLFLHPFLQVHAVWKSSFVPVVIDEFGKCTSNNGATRNWKLGIGNPVECITNLCNFVMGMKFWGEVVKPLNSKSIKVNRK